MLTIRNKHKEAMPEVEGKDILYLSYFENEYGDQFIYFVDKDKKENILIGEQGWKQYKASERVLSHSESVWIDACRDASEIIREGVE